MRLHARLTLYGATPNKPGSVSAVRHLLLQETHLRALPLAPSGQAYNKPVHVRSARIAREYEDRAALDAALTAELVEAIEDRDGRWLARALKRMHPADAADMLEQLSPDAFSEAVNCWAETCRQRS